MRSRGIVLLASVLLGGCAAVLGWDDFVAGTAPPTEIEGGPGAEAGPAPAPEGEEANADLYVSTSGDDANDGTRARPLRSVARAVDRTRSGPEPRPRRIAICAGQFDLVPPLNVVSAVVISGGYDCKTWRRPVSPDDGIGLTTGASPTRLVGTGPAAALIAVGPEPGDAGQANDGPSLDRLAANAKDCSAAIAGTGKVRLSHVQVIARGGPADGNTVFGLSFALAELTVDHVDVEVRTDTDGTLAAGLSVLGSSLSVRRSRVLVHDSPSACTAVSGELSDVVLTENAFNLSECRPTESRAPETGIVAVSSEVRSSRNFVQLNAPGSRAADTFTVHGVLTARSVQGGSRAGRFESDGDRIVGPVFLHPNQNTTLARLRFLGFHDEAGSFARVVNASVILDSSRYALAVTGQASTAVSLKRPTAAIVRHNSIYFSRTATPDDALLLLGLAFDPTALDPDAGSSVAANLLVSDDTRSSFVRPSCPAPGVNELGENRVAGAVGIDGGACALAGAASNVALVCSPADGGCRNLFSNLDTAGTDGLRPSPSACAQNVATATNDVTVDGVGAVRRTDRTTAGAFECP